MKLHVRHRTHYAYARNASQSYNQVCLQPRTTFTQRCLESRVEVHPEPGNLEYDSDVFGNFTARFSLDQRHKDCDIIVTSLVETNDTLLPLPPSIGVAENLSRLNALGSSDALMAQDCLLSSPFIGLTHALDGLMDEIPLGNQSVLEYADQLMQYIYRTFEYESDFSTLVTPLSEIYSARKGVCQDFAHLAIATLRRQGIPARYVSGYLETLPPPGQKKLQGADASHAWYAVFDASNGWFDFDPTNNKRPDAQYVTTAWGRDYGDVTPVKGVVYGGGTHTLTVEVDVTRSGESMSAITES